MGMALKTSAGKTGFFVTVLWILWTVAGAAMAALNPQQFPGA